MCAAHRSPIGLSSQNRRGPRHRPRCAPHGVRHTRECQSRPEPEYGDESGCVRPRLEGRYTAEAPTCPECPDWAPSIQACGQRRPAHHQIVNKQYGPGPSEERATSCDDGKRYWSRATGEGGPTSSSAKTGSRHPSSGHRLGSPLQGPRTPAPNRQSGFNEPDRPKVREEPRTRRSRANADESTNHRFHAI